MASKQPSKNEALEPTRLISFDFAPLVKSLENLRTGLASLEKKNKGLIDARTKDLGDLDKYKDGQRKVVDLLNKNITEADDRIAMSETNIKKNDNSIFQLQIDRDVQEDFAKEQRGKNSDTNLEFIKVANKIQTVEKAAADNLSIKFTEIKKLVTKTDDALSKRITALDELSPKMDKCLADIEKQDLYVFEVNEKFEKLEAELNSLKEDIKSGALGGPPPGDFGQAPGQPVQQVQTQAQQPQQSSNAAPVLDIRSYVKRAIQEQEPSTKEQLNQLVSFQIQNDKEEEASKDPDSQPSQFEFSHIPSMVEQIIEEHVRQVADKLVYLEYLRPRFRHFELASEISQIFNHVEVQTFQQDQILKSNNAADQGILELNIKIEELTQQIGKNTTRLDQFDAGRTQDIEKVGELQDKSDQFRHILQIFSDMKTDVLARCGSKEFVKELDSRIATIEKDNLKSQQEAQAWMGKKLDAAVEQFSAFDKQLQGLQLQIMKNETQVFDFSRQVSDFTESMEKFERLDKSIEDAKKGHVPDNGLAQKLYVEMNLAPMHVVKKLQEDVTDVLTQLKSADQRIDFLKTKFDDHTKLIRTIDKRSQEAEKQAKELKILSDNIQKSLKTKIEATDFDDEIRHISAQISALDVQGKANMMRGQNMRQLPKPQKAAAGGAGGLSKEDKKKLEDTFKQVESIESSFRVLSQTIHNLNIDDIKETLKQIPEKAEIKKVDQLQMTLLTEINGLKAQLKNQDAAVTRQFQTLTTKSQRLFELDEEGQARCKDLLEQCNRIEDSIQGVKRLAKQAELKAKMSNKVTAVAVAPPVQEETSKPQEQAPAENFEEQTQEMQEKLQRDLLKINNRISDLTEEIRRLKVGNQGGGGAGQKGALRTIETSLSKLERNYERDISQINEEVKDLAHRFDEKIRRQQLVQTKKQLSPNASDEDLMKNLKSRPKFMAQHITRELAINGRLPQLENYGDHLARYGKGFSQMLGIAGDQRPIDPSVVGSPRMMEGFTNLPINDSEMHHDVSAVTLDNPHARRLAAEQDDEQNKTVRVISKRSGSIQHNTQANNSVENPFAQTSPSRQQISQRRNTSNRTHLDTSHKKVKIEEAQGVMFSPLTRSDSIQLVLPQIK